MIKYTPEQLINSIEPLVNSGIDKSSLLTEVQAAIQKRQKEITWALGVNVFESNTPETKAIRDKIAQYLLGTDKKEESAVTLDTETQAALKRVEELKRRYTPEQIAEMRKLRAEVEEMVSEFEAVDRDKNLSDEAKKQAKLKLLSKYNIPKYRGKRLDGDPVEFVGRADTYGRFIRANVIFKPDIRKMDKGLVATINQEVCRNSVDDPLMTEDQKTEMTAAKILGNEKQQQLSLAMILRREPHKKLQKEIKTKLNH